MQFILVDSDEAYLQQLNIQWLRTGLTKTNNMSAFFFKTKKILYKEELSEDSLLILSERDLIEFWTNQCLDESVPDLIRDYVRQGRWLILVEEMYSKTILDIQNFFQEKLHESYTQVMIEDHLVKKYQSTELLVFQLFERGLIFIPKISRQKREKVQITSLYTPEVIPLWTEHYIREGLKDDMSKPQRQSVKKLIIYWGYISLSKERHVHNLSILLRQLKRGNSNYYKLFDELSYEYEGCRIIEGVHNVLDLDEFTYHDMYKILSWLEEESDFNQVLFIIEGMHVTKEVKLILEKSGMVYIQTKSIALLEALKEQMSIDWQTCDYKLNIPWSTLFEKSVDQGEDIPEQDLKESKF